MRPPTFNRNMASVCTFPGSAVAVDDTLIRLLVALLLGAAVGLEREYHHHIGGIRTNGLVALGAASFTLFGTMVEGADSPARVAAQVVSGIGFLGGGVILREGLTIHGLSTAATIWTSAALGVFSGIGYFAQAAIAAVLILGANIALRPIVVLISRQPGRSSDGMAQYDLQIVCRAADEARIRALLLHEVSSGALSLRSIDSRPALGPATESAEVLAVVVARLRNDHAVEAVVGRLVLDGSVTSAKWQLQPMVT
jgi:putative Mg2+ transporter-C (MgtC) family protein